MQSIKQLNHITPTYPSVPGRAGLAAPPTAMAPPWGLFIPPIAPPFCTPAVEF